MHHSQNTCTKTPNILFLLIIFLLCIPALAKTQEDSLWHDLGLYGGQIKTIAVDPLSGSMLYAGSYMGGGLFKSFDQGVTWKEIPGFRDTEVYDITFDPNHPETLWVAHNQYIQVSRDDGATWQKFLFAEAESRFCYAVRIDPHDASGDTVYVGTGGPDGRDEWGAVFKTIDGGDHWFKTSLIASYNVLRLSINPSRSGEIWAASSINVGLPQGKIYVTSDSGMSWGSWDIGWYLDDLAIHPVNPSLIFAAGELGLIRKLDGIGKATGWQQLEPQTLCHSLCLIPESPDTLYAALENKIAASIDAGKTWSYYTVAQQFLSLAADPLQSDIVYGGDLNKGVFKSTDGARSFAEINNGIRANQIFSIDSSPAQAPSILAGTLAGVYIRDATMRWNLINDGHAEAVAFHPQNDSIIYAGFPLKIGKSTDRGTTWSYQSISSLSEMHDVSSIAVSSRAPELVVAGIYFYSGKKGRIIKSTDTGETYNLMWETTVPVNTVRIHPVNPLVIFAGTGSFYAPVAPGGLFVSSDGGATWQKTSLQNVIVNSVAISSLDPRIIYAGCGGSDNAYSGIYKSSDGGATWQKTPRGLPHEYAITSLQIDTANMNIVYAASFYGGVYLTVDGGDYWTQIGLSDYLIYDVILQAQPSDIKQIKTAGTVTAPLPVGTIVAGTTSGIYQYAAGDTGTLCGIITSAETGAPIDAAQVSVSCGSSCMSSDGYYLLLVPSGTHTIEVQAAGYERADLPGIAVSSGQSVSYDIALHPSDTTCPATALLLGTPYQNYLENLKAFRDRVLRRTSRGKQLISLYYTAGAELVRLLNAHPELRTPCLSVMREIMPAVAASLADKPVSIPASVLNKIETVVSDIEGAAAEDMKVKIHAVQVILREDGLLKILKGR